MPEVIFNMYRLKYSYLHSPLRMITKTPYSVICTVVRFIDTGIMDDQMLLLSTEFFNAAVYTFFIIGYYRSL